MISARQIIFLIVIATTPTAAVSAGTVSTSPEIAKLGGDNAEVKVRNILIMNNIPTEQRAMIYRASSCGSRQYRVAIVSVGAKTVGELFYGCDGSCSYVAGGSTAPAPGELCNDIFYSGRFKDEDGL